MTPVPDTSSQPTKIGIVGVGKIVRDQHLPAIASSGDFELLACASRNATVDGVQNFSALDEMLDAVALDAVALCMPPQCRYTAAHRALQRGKHVFLEKPPGATLSEVEELANMATAADCSLFASWHSRFAPAVEAMRARLAASPPHRVRITWKEDVRSWHPGQAWIWQPGGFGVFDPGINALSILTHILPRSVHLAEATLDFPANRDAPIAARLKFADAAGTPVEAEFDWRQQGRQSWDIEAETDAGNVLLADGGSRLVVNGDELPSAPEAEYPALYARFAELIATRSSEVDVAPLRHVADAFMLGRRRQVDAFHD